MLSLSLLRASLTLSICSYGSWLFGGSGYYDQPIASADERIDGDAEVAPGSRRQKRRAQRATAAAATTISGQLASPSRNAAPLVASIANSNDDDDVDVEDQAAARQQAAAFDRARTWAGYSARHASVPMYGSVAIRADEPLESSLTTPWRAVVVCLTINFVFTLPFTCLETIGPPYTASNPHLRWGTVANGVYFCVLGVVCILRLVFGVGLGHSGDS